MHRIFKEMPHSQLPLQKEKTAEGEPFHWSEFDSIIGESQPIRELKRRLSRIARSDANVLITGETGTGKELVAAAIHRASRRSHRDFVCVNCAALPDSLFESELFGHARGAYTGAFEARRGKLKQSDGGTVFLDEIGELSLQAQAKLLRAIETHEIQMLGCDATTRADFRVVAATNQDLEKRVGEGFFRRDLYYRLNVARIHLHPLRERMEDLLLLIRHFLDQFNRQFGMCVKGLAPEVLERFRAYSWPGNVREVRNFLEAAYLSVQGPYIQLEDVTEALHARDRQVVFPAPTERDRLLDMLREVNWNKSKAASRLHWSRMTLYRKLVKYCLKEPQT